MSFPGAPERSAGYPLPPGRFGPGGPGMLRGRRVGRELELPEAPPALRSLVLVCGGRGLRSTRRDGVGTSRVF